VSVERSARINSGWLPNSLDEVLSFLQVDLQQAPEVLFRAGIGFGHSVLLLSKLGDPQEAVPVVHIAGTAGKGSVAYALASALSALGLRVGLHVSPHVYDVRERFQVDGRLATAGETVELLRSVLTGIRSLDPEDRGSSTFFEATVAMAFVHFLSKRCDIAVVETGLGGLYDTTNVVRRSDKLGVITRIGIDHERVLGGDLPTIANQKAGILPLGGEAVVLSQPAEGVNAAIRRVAQERRCRIHFVHPPPRRDNAAHLVENQALVRRALQVLEGRGVVSNPLSIELDLRLAMPGRFERLNFARKTVLLDGAHNPVKLEALIDRLRVEFPNQQAAWVFGCRPDKKVLEMLRVLARTGEPVCFVQFEIAAGDVPGGLSVPVDELCSASSAIGLDARRASSLEEAADFLLGSDENVGVAVGSFSLLSQLRPVLHRRPARGA
jgi:dihydrofolate synthase/folylpolyglutamate synthase